MHADGRGDHSNLACGQRALGEGTGHRVGAAGYQRGYGAGRASPTTVVQNDPLAGQRVAIVVAWHHIGADGELPAVQSSQFPQLDRRRPGYHWACAPYVAQQGILLATDRSFRGFRAHFTAPVAQLLPRPTAVRQSWLLGRQQSQHLPAACHPCWQTLAVGSVQWAPGDLDDHGAGAQLRVRSMKRRQPVGNLGDIVSVTRDGNDHSWLTCGRRARYQHQHLPLSTNLLLDGLQGTWPDAGDYVGDGSRVVGTSLRSPVARTVTSDHTADMSARPAAAAEDISSPHQRAQPLGLRVRPDLVAVQAPVGGGGAIHALIRAYPRPQSTGQAYSVTGECR